MHYLASPEEDRIVVLIKYSVGGGFGSRLLLDEINIMVDTFAGPKHNRVLSPHPVCNIEKPHGNTPGNEARRINVHTNC